MRDETGFETLDDDDLDAVLVDDETGVEDRAPQHVVFEIGISDPGPATELARQAAELGYTVEVRGPDDADGFYEVSCASTIAGSPADVSRARRELEALAEELGCVRDDDERDTAEIG